MRKAKTIKDAGDDSYGEARELLSTPLLLERSDDEGDDEGTDDPAESPRNRRGSRERGSVEEARGAPPPTPELGAARQRTRGAPAPRGRTEAAAAAAAAAAAVSQSSGWEDVEASVETVQQHQRDYRSEGDQPSTERNGNRRPLKHTRQDSFRAARMPKRGGRKRLRRLRPVRRKIRVSSYCVSRELQTLQLLRWLETQTNRRLSQSIRAHGGAGPRGPVSAAARTAAAGAVAMSTVAGASTRPVPRGGGRGFAGRSAGTLTAAAAASRGEETPTVEQLEWMDSLYIDVIHSTTDLRGGLRKARDLERPAWEDVVDEEEEGGGGGGSYDGGAVRDRRAGRREGSGGREREEQDDDDNDVVTHKDVMFFPYGAVVFWGCSEAEEKEMLSSLNRFMVGKVSDTELAQSFDDMTFVYRHPDGKKNVPLKNDEITLDTRDPAEKLAYSCALAQSAKLFVFEERLDNIIESTAKYPQILAATGKIPLTEIEIGRLVGRVLCEQNEVNLHSDILDTPEYFWEEDAWEPAYEALCAYLDIPLRLDNVNKRLSILRELLDVLSTQSTNSHATRLEVIIIYLILIEVAIELVWNVIIKDVFHLVGEEYH